jgi:parallel beta-helix repeat protein
MKSVWRVPEARLTALAAGAILACGPARAAVVAEALVVTPNVRAAGVRLSVTGDGGGEATASLFYRPVGQEAWRAALPLARVDAGRFAGSLFGLTPGLDYEARAVVTGAEGFSATSEVTTAFRTRAEVFLEEVARRVWHVAPGGRDGARGAPGSPLRTIQEAVDRAEAGDTVLVAPGVYREAVTVRRSGAPGAPLRIRAAGPGVILDGAEPRLARVNARRQWRRESGGLYSTAMATRPGYVAVDGARLYAFDTVAALQAGAEEIAGGWCYDPVARRLYVSLPGGGDPDIVPIQAARLPHAFLLDGARHVTIEGFTIRFFGVNAFGKGILLLDASQCVVRGNRIENTNRGIWVKGVARENRIEENEIADTSVAAWPAERVFGSDAEGAGITLTAGAGNVVRGNVIRGTWDGIVVSSWGDLANEGYGIDLDVEANEVIAVGNRGLALEGAGINVRFQGNRAQGARVGLSLLPVTVGPCYAVRNVLAAFREVGIAVGGASGPCYLLHNSAASAAPGARGIVTAGPWISLALRNNAIRVAGSPLEAPFGPAGLTLDFDALFSEGDAPLVRWDTTPFSSLSDFQAATGHELSGLAADPGFADPEGGDLRLLSDSPLRDRGALLPNVNDDTPDGLPDIGALEG